MLSALSGCRALSGAVSGRGPLLGVNDRCIKLWGVYRARAKHVDFGMVNNYNLGYYRPSGLPLVSKMPPVSDLYSEQSTYFSSP